MKKKKNKHQQNAGQQNAGQQPVNNNDPKAEQPQFIIMVPVFPNGRVEVANFPQNFTMEQVMDVLCAALVRVAQHFRQLSDDKNLGRIIKLNQQQAAMVGSKIAGRN